MTTLLFDHPTEFIERIFDAIRMETQRRKAVLMARQCRHVATEQEMDQLHELIGGVVESDDLGNWLDEPQTVEQCTSVAYGDSDLEQWQNDWQNTYNDLRVGL